MMVDEIKKRRYEELVEKLKEIYPQFDYSFDPSKKSIPPQFWSPYVKIDGKMSCICNEINLYTYWQGLGYAQKTPKIKYLLVGQDYGNIFNISNKRFMEINAGNKNLPYVDETNSITDENLKELFKVLGYDDIMKRYDELFFTNFCLAYRTGVMSGSMKAEAMKKSAPLFKELCEILEPKNILCLGKQTFKYVYETLNEGMKAKNLKLFNKNYKIFLEHHEDLKVQCGNVESRIYPLAHCGTLGSMNRSRGLPKQNDELHYQKLDWSRIAKDN